MSIVSSYVNSFNGCMLLVYKVFIAKHILVMSLNQILVNNVISDSTNIYNRLFGLISTISSC